MIKKIIIGFFVVFILGSVFFSTHPQNPSVSHPVIQPSPTVSAKPTTFSYKGVAGKDALSLLRLKAVVELDQTGMVASINGQVADTKKKEYWAFYVNNKYASVGPKDYVTKENDIILWKIEKF